jgi:DNA (cytosine-5)-methyltransferase 3A
MTPPHFGNMVARSHPWWPGHIYKVRLTVSSMTMRYTAATATGSSWSSSSATRARVVRARRARPLRGPLHREGSPRRGRRKGSPPPPRRIALALLCQCSNPNASRPHPSDVIFFLVNLPAFDTNVDYHRHQTQAARQRFVRRRSSTKCLTLPWLMAQRDAAEKAAHTVPGMEMTTLFSAYRRAVFSPIDHLRPSVGTSGWIPSFRLLRTREPRRQSELNKVSTLIGIAVICSCLHNIIPTKFC